MENSSRQIKNRRKFLRMLAASPLLALPGPLHNLLQELLASGNPGTKDALTLFESLEQGEALINNPEQAFDVMDFEPVARKNLPPAHFGFLATGVDDDATVRANHEGYLKIQIRARRLIDVSNIDTSVRLFGTAWDNPIALSPVGDQKAFHPEGELAAARAARTKGHLQILSTVTSYSVEDVIAARGAPIWFQLYVNNVWDIVRAVIKRAEAAGCPVLVLTVDLKEGSNRETLFRAERADSRQCSICHTNGFKGFGRVANRPMFAGLDVSKATGLISSALNWDYVKRLKDTTTMKLVLKGIVTREDAQLAVEHGVDGIIVSNHGGRAEETLRPTIESLPEVLEGTAGKIPVIVDGGVRRGTDIFKALALGATAVGIGRPYIWGLAAFGQPGVEAVLTILRRELQTIMRQAGTTSIDKVTSAYLAKKS